MPLCSLKKFSNLLKQERLKKCKSLKISFEIYFFENVLFIFIHEVNQSVMKYKYVL